jgi:hypothetical protein
LRRGSSGGEAFVAGRAGIFGKVASSFGAGLFDFERIAAVPEARLSQEGFDFVGGFGAPSTDDRRDSKDVWADDMGGEGMGLATSA